jgi:NADPH-dependent 2,4-dienoyl-CoA reductase/sulfur reductase-like enzyme
MHSTDVAIVGAGFIDLEVAASCRARGLHVTVIESASAPPSPVFRPTLCEMVAAMHRDHAASRSSTRGGCTRRRQEGAEK